METDLRRTLSELDILLKEFPNMKIERTHDSIQLEGSYANMSRFEKEFKWRPSVNLETGIKEIIEYEKYK